MERQRNRQRQRQTERETETENVCLSLHIYLITTKIDTLTCCLQMPNVLSQKEQKWKSRLKPTTKNRKK